ncbi:MAG: 2-hydroxyacyl-CoA dehydratase [Deltaproteobacteria bacterium]|nr:2-hydroxyacyl-CoA dehydratase [Deltaproteobacteria bacterium]
MEKDKNQQQKSIKRLQSSIDANAYQKAWFKDLREKINNGESYAIVSADAPHEIFHAMDIPIVTTQWWSAVIAAKQLSSYYFDLLNERGYGKDLCRYCSLPLASAMDHNPEMAPWGGLPKPTVIVARLTCDAMQKVYDLWAKEMGAPFFPFENPGSTVMYPRWWEKCRYDWEALYETRRLDVMVEDLKALIRFLEIQTGKTFSYSKFVRIMDRINEQEEIYDKIHDLVAKTVPCPISITDSIPSVMNPQWHRGSQWALDMTKQFYEEVKACVDQGQAACENEKIRLMWIGAGLWFNTGFYNAFEEKYGAVFVWSMYLALAADGYIRYPTSDPLRALASRFVSMNEQLHMPPWMNEWLVKEAKLHKINGALILTPTNCKHSGGGTYFTKKALEKAGIPTIDIWADMVDAREWDNDQMIDLVSEFIEGII